MAENIIEVPAEVVQNCNGFSMDFGGSVLKLVYRHKDDWKELQSQKKDSKTGKLRLRSYARPDFKDALELLKENAYISRDGENTPVIYTTGIGCYQNADTIKTTLGVKTEMLGEFDCFMKSFCYLIKRQGLEQLEFKFPKEMADNIKSLEESMVKMVLAMKEVMEATQSNWKIADPTANKQTETVPAVISRDKPIEEAFPDLYPCAFAMLGSGFAYMQVKADGSFDLMDGMNRGGRMFLGLGSLLAGATSTYPELMAMAMKGNNKNVGIFRTDLKADGNAGQSDGNDAGYALVEMDDIQDDIIYCFGKASASSPDSFKKEDLISALLHTMVMDVVQNLHISMILKDIKRCFLGGSFINHELVRYLITEEWTKRKLMMSSLCGGKGLDYELYFLNVGSHLGALGCLVNYTEPVLGPPDIEETHL